MKAAVIHETGGPEVLSYEDVPDPSPGPTEIVIRVGAIGIEGGDTLHRKFGPFAKWPHIVGYQCAGEVVGVGADVDGFVPGQRVVTLGLDGSHAELRVADARASWAIPDEMDFTVAASIPVAFGTAHDCLHDFGHLRAEETVLIHAGAGGVGIAAIQMAKKAGATVITTASSRDRLDRLREFGADHGICYTSTDFVEVIAGICEGRGVDLVVDSIGGATLAKSISVLGYRGRCITLGDAGRDDAVPIDLGTLRPNNQTVSGYFLGAELLLTPRTHPMIAQCIDDVASGELRVVVDRTFPLRDASAAHAHVESRTAFGRVVLIP